MLALDDRPLDAVARWEVGGGAPRPIFTVDTAFVSDTLGWSRDGARFVFVGSEAGTWTAYELSAPSGGVRAIRSEVERFSVVRDDARPWSPGGEAYYLILEDGGLAIRDVRTETTHQLEASGVTVIGWQRSPSD